ncbi:hypothetical protein CPSG_08904 [Coccidioides posadasii str. Silveira]|uniref:Uncharacterized protein n=1 Tax=Coccidioides posadasii (strain RMSCC 757 / Silveira) TaxID=443226 RepID=E9DGF5_COCPS|nr:hypothetical protein CPSG_08904 [Coccidioides posadasii str. Silveira]
MSLVLVLFIRQGAKGAFLSGWVTPRPRYRVIRHSSGLLGTGISLSALISARPMFFQRCSCETVRSKIRHLAWVILPFFFFCFSFFPFSSFCGYHFPSAF